MDYFVFLRSKLRVNRLSGVNTVGAVFLLYVRRQFSSWSAAKGTVTNVWQTAFQRGLWFYIIPSRPCLSCDTCVSSLHHSVLNLMPIKGQSRLPIFPWLNIRWINPSWHYIAVSRHRSAVYTFPYVLWDLVDPPRQSSLRPEIKSKQ